MTIMQCDDFQTFFSIFLRWKKKGGELSLILLTFCRNRNKIIKI